MCNQIRILHIDSEYKVTYFILRNGASIHSLVSLEQTVELLKTQEFDLILSEPHNQAILKPQSFPEVRSQNQAH
jgi:hypothetical protein